jgi:hypothetical protein
MAGESESEAIDAKIDELGDWRGETLSRVRELTREALPEVVEEIKWRKPSNPSGVPTWSQDGILFTGETYKDKVKLTFAKGASVDDPTGLFNSSLEGNTRAPSTSTRGMRSTGTPSRLSSGLRPTSTRLSAVVSRRPRGRGSR